MRSRSRTTDSPVGTLRLTVEDGAITRIDWAVDGALDSDATGDPNSLLDEATRQLGAYFDGVRQTFDLPLAPTGTRHDRDVWMQMQTIPFGATRSYGEIASAIGSSPRAVGTACGRNPIPIVIPCHRVLAAGGRIGGYSGSGGTTTKRQLLVLEGAMLAV